MGQLDLVKHQCQQRLHHVHGLLGLLPRRVPYLAYHLPLVGRSPSNSWWLGQRKLR